VRRYFLTLFLALLILTSVGGVISFVGAASHVTPVQVSKSTAVAPVSKLTYDIHRNYAGDLRAVQQTYILATLNSNATMVIMGVGQSVYLHGILSAGTPPASWRDSSHGVPDMKVNIQCMNSDGNMWTVNIQRINSDENTWTTVYTERTNPPNAYPTKTGTFIMTLTPKVAGTYNYRITYDGDGQYAPAVSNVVTLAVTNVAIFYPQLHAVTHQQ
jgi:hypothetical protein